jgi:two-component system, LytTR family, response regulator
MTVPRVRRIRTLVVDDEPLARRSLTALLERDAEIELLTECGSAKQAVARIRAERPQLLFLDVHMPEHDGFEVLQMLGTELPAAVVFVTAYDEYALGAFEAGALDYLLKPFDDRRFGRALARAKERLGTVDAAGARSRRIAVRSATGIEFLRLEEIDWVEAADYYTCLHVGARSHLLRRSLATLVRELDPALFLRIHRSTIVNLERVRALRLNEAGEYDIVLTDGTKLRLSRRFRKAALETFGLREETPLLPNRPNTK